jgi:hypothetical protein
MTSPTSQSTFNADALSQSPEIRSFEFDKKAIGEIKSSVNKFRGSVSLPLDFLKLPGRDGLDVKLSIVYSSSIRRMLTTWNLEAPTGIVGLGWQLPIEMIVVETSGSAAPASNRYYLMSSGAANPLAKTGETNDGKWIFEARNYQFWSISYDPKAQSWTIVKENGFVYTYGGDGDQAATQWGVRWGNWIGSSSQRAAQARYPIAWNLATVESTMGNKVRYYYREVASAVMQSGLAYTQASYVDRVVDSYGRTLKFNYGEKLGALNPGNLDGRPVLEYQARHTQLSAPNAYQDRYETLYLDSVDLLNPDGVPLYGVKLTYEFINAASNSDTTYSLMFKRCLRSVFQYAPDGETLPAMRFDYFAITSDINPGALRQITYPEGGVGSFTYKKNFIASPRKLTIQNPLSGSIPRVWFGPNYVVFTYAGASGMRVVVRSWNGQWVTQDVTGPMGSRTLSPGSLLVLTG